TDGTDVPWCSNVTICGSLPSRTTAAAVKVVPRSTARTYDTTPPSGRRSARGFLVHLPTWRRGGRTLPVMIQHDLDPEPDWLASWVEHRLHETCPVGVGPGPPLGLEVIRPRRFV